MGLFGIDSNKNKKDNSVNVDTTSQEEIVNNNPVVDDSINVSSNRNRGMNRGMNRRMNRGMNISRSKLRNLYLQNNPTKREFRYNDPVPQPASSLINPKKRR